MNNGSVTAWGTSQNDIFLQGDSGTVHHLKPVTLGVIPPLSDINVIAYNCMMGLTTSGEIIMWGNQDALVANWGPIPSGSYVVIPRDELQIEVTSTIKIQADPSRTTGSVIDIRDTSNNKLLNFNNDGSLDFSLVGKKDANFHGDVNISSSDKAFTSQSVINANKGLNIVGASDTEGIITFKTGTTDFGRLKIENLSGKGKLNLDVDCDGTLTSAITMEGGVSSKEIVTEISGHLKAGKFAANTTVPEPGKIVDLGRFQNTNNKT